MNLRSGSWSQKVCRDTTALQQLSPACVAENAQTAQNLAMVSVLLGANSQNAS